MTDAEPEYQIHGELNCTEFRFTGFFVSSVAFFKNVRCLIKGSVKKLYADLFYYITSEL